MRDWGNYELSDLLLFTQETYYRQFELYNTEIWPAQIAGLAGGLLILALAWRSTADSGRIIAPILAVGWIGPAWGYFLTRHAFINWLAPYYGWAFIAEAVLLILIGGLGGRLTFRGPMSRVQRIGLALFLFALLLQPTFAPLMGRPWAQAEFFGFMPDPTVVATLGLLLAADRVRWLLLVIPVLWCAVSGATLWTMGSPAFFVPPAAAALVLMLAVGRAVTRGETARSESPPG